MGQKHSFPYFKDGEIKIELTTTQIIAGQQLNGFVHVNQRKAFRSRGLFLSLSGYEKSTFSRTIGDEGKRQQLSERYPICKTEWLLIDLTNEKANCIANPGQFTIPFSI